MHQTKTKHLNGNCEMVNFKIKVADLVFDINALFQSTRAYCADYITDKDAQASFSITPEDIEFERKKSIHEAEIEGIPYVERSDELLETTAVQRKITEELFAFDTLLFHGSVIAVDGFAYLFTAKSGTGKSTHTRLWRELLGDRAVMVNDDKPFLTVGEGQVTVHGSPWNGKHRLGTNISLPLRAICILERGEGNRIVKIKPAEAISMLIQQSSRPRDSALMSKYLELIDGVARGVSFYRLSCNMELEAAQISFEAMSKDE